MDLLQKIRAQKRAGLLGYDEHNREYEKTSSQFALLQTTANERKMHAWLKKNPYLLLSALEGGGQAIERVAMFTEFRLGLELRTDFAIVRADSDGARWTFIELESPKSRLFTKNGDPTKELRHGLRQLHDWSAYIKDNEAAVKKRFAHMHEKTEIRGPYESWRAPNFVVIIGRSSTLTTEQRRLKAEMNDRDPRCQIVSYDRLALQPWRPGAVRPFGTFDTVLERGQLDGKPWPNDPNATWRIAPKYMSRKPARAKLKPN